MSSPNAGKLRPTRSALPIDYFAQVEVRSCMLGGNLIRDSDVLVAELVVVVDSGSPCSDDN